MEIKKMLNNVMDKLDKTRTIDTQAVDRMIKNNEQTKKDQQSSSK